MGKRLLYWGFVRQEAKAIGSDGCTLVSELYHDCCSQHDLGYRYGKDPRSAYALYLADTPNYWVHARDVDRSFIDTQFRECIQVKSKLGRFSPISWLRWTAVRAGGWKPWRTYRRSPQNAPGATRDA